MAVSPLFFMEDVLEKWICAGMEKISGMSQYNSELQPSNNQCLYWVLGLKPL